MKKRDIVVSIILSLVTCGIYSLVWFVGITDDVKTVSEDTQMQSGGIALLLTIVTCGIYGIYWAYKMGDLMKTAQTKKNLPVKDNAILYVVLELFGLGIVVQALIQSDLNQMIPE